MLYHLLFKLRDVFVGFTSFATSRFRTAFARSPRSDPLILGPWMIGAARIKLGSTPRGGD